MNNRASFKEIRHMLQARAGDLARMLAPGGVEKGGVYSAPNPTRADHKAGSFKIYTAGAKAGGWVDYAGVNAAFEAGGDRGDIIDLIAYVMCGRDRKAAIKWAEDYLGLSRMDPKQKAGLAERARLAAAKQAAAEKVHVLRREERARVLFSQTVSIFGTHGEAYLRSRGIRLADLPNFNAADVRFHPGLEWWEGAERINGVRVPGPEFPAIICAIRDREGVLRGVHCTFLDAEFARKAPVAKPKLMFGTVAGCVIRITNAEDGEVLEQSTLRVDLGVGEGLEDGLTIALGLPGDRVWAATSLGNLGNVYADHPLVRCVIVARDNDWGKPQARRQFESALDALESHGKPVAVVSSPAGKDFNDLMKE